MNTIVWSPQQADFIEWCATGEGSCVLEAVAGSGKTTTLLEGVKRMPGKTAILAYNKKIAEEIKAKVIDMFGPDGWRKAQAGTVHSFGYGAYRKARPRCVVKEYKVADKLDALFEQGNSAVVPLKAHFPIIAKLVSLAKQKALGIVEGSISDKSRWLDIATHFDVFGDEEFLPVEPIIEVAIEMLYWSIEELDVIDFDDMIYMPIYHKVKIWPFDNVMVDEAQDTNPARRALVRALVKKGGRVIAVGDRHQAIYGFTGADADSLDLIKQDFAAIDLPLTTTYRCPKAVVSFAQQWVKHIVAHETAPEGSVSTIALDDFLKRNDLDGGAAVLCRLTKPLVSLAFRLIRQRVACRVEGRDVGAAIKKLVNRWKVNELDDLEDRLSDYLAKETTKLLAKKEETRLAVVEDTVETIRVMIEQCRMEGKHSVGAVNDYIDMLFSDNVKGMLVLSTIHKSKGREWERVFWLDRRNTCPSKWARQDWQREQEDNLCYVAATRAKNELIEVLVPSKADKQQREEEAVG